jgi:Flp pilus assembly protein protease CpaA
MASTTESAAIVQWGVVLVASLVAALWDLKSRQIPNVLTLPLLAAGIVLAAVQGDLKSSLLAAILLGLPYILLFLFAGGGAGDAKLMLAIGAWLGLSSGVVALLAISICAVIFALLKAAFHKLFFAVLRRIQDMIVSFFLLARPQGVRKAATSALSMDADDQQRLTMPYGPAIFAGLVVAAVYSWLKS